MKVSCLMPTFNRGDLLVVEEALHSFIEQDYSDRELILCNDCPEQKLLFDHELVKVLNVEERFPTLSDKFEFMLQHADSELICRWDDDDIHLPHRLSLSVKKLDDGMIWTPHNFWFTATPNEDPLRLVNYNMNASSAMGIWRRDVLDQIGGFPTGVSGSEGALFEYAVRMAGVPQGSDALAPKDIFYFFRWGLEDPGVFNLSSPTQAAYGTENPHQVFYDLLGEMPVTRPGEIELTPRWRRDYLADVKEAIARIADE